MTPEVAVLMVETVAACAAAAGALSPGRWADARLRGAWRWLGLGVLSWALANVVYLALVLRGIDPGVPSIAEPGFLLTLPLLAVGIHRWPAATRPRATRAIVLDGLLGAAAMVLLLWVGAFHLLVGAPSSNSAELVTTLVYPVGDVVILQLLLSTLRRREVTGRRSLALLSAGVLSITLADLVYAALSAVSQRDITNVWTDGPWIVGFALMAVGAVLARRSAAAAPEQQDSDDDATDDVGAPTGVDERSTAAVVGTDPVLARISLYLGAIALLAAVARLAAAGGSDAGTVLLSLVVVTLMLARQVNALDVNGRLTSELQDEVARLARQAHHDHLTGLPNRVGLEDRIALAGRRSAERQRLAAVMFIDLDHLKTVNDSLGHEFGDELIRAVANRLTARLGDRVTRFGGDEFVVVVDDVVDRGALEHLADAVVADGTRPVDLGGLELRPSLSVGYTLVEPGTSADELLRRADLALYRSKRLGRQRSVEYHPRMDDRAARRVDLEPDLRRALDHDEFTVYFQPVVALCNGRLVGAEALIRWQHPTRGLVMPGEFLPEADAAGLLGAIGERALQQACTAFAEANSRPGQDPVVVSVNLSASELEDRHVVARVGLALDRSGLAPHHLSLEITEDVIINRSIRRTIDDLLDIGVNLSIDDFGTGNSSLRQLGSYPATALKIDRAYVADMDRTPEGATVVRAVIGLAERFGMITIAEGVERPTQVEQLQELGCFAGQGWVYDRALPYAEFASRHLVGPPSRIDLRRTTGPVDPADGTSVAPISLPTLLPDPPDASAPRPPR